MLKARLYEFELEKKKKKEDLSIEQSKSDIGWGHQIADPMYCTLID